MGGGFALSKAGVPVGDTWTDAATFQTAELDKLDVTANLGDVLVQFLIHGTRWDPPGGVVCRRGLFKSISGLATMYGQVTGFRFQRARTGGAATVDFDAYTV